MEVVLFAWRTVAGSWSAKLSNEFADTRKSRGSGVDRLGTARSCLPDLPGDIRLGLLSHGARHSDAVLAHARVRPFLGFVFLYVARLAPTGNIDVQVGVRALVQEYIKPLARDRSWCGQPLLMNIAAPAQAFAPGDSPAWWHVLLADQCQSRGKGLLRCPGGRGIEWAARCHPRGLNAYVLKHLSFVIISHCLKTFCMNDDEQRHRLMALRHRGLC
jgi:hypothetical protein